MYWRSRNKNGRSWFDLPSLSPCEVLKIGCKVQVSEPFHAFRMGSTDFNMDEPEKSRDDQASLMVFPVEMAIFFGVYLSHFQIHRRMKWWMTWWMKWYRWYGWSQAPKFRLQDWQHDQLYKGGSIQKMDSEMGFSRNGPKLIQNLLKISKHHPRSVRNHRSFEFLSQFRAETPAFAPHFRVWGSSPSCCRRAWRDPCSFYTTWEMHQLRGMPWSTMACLKSLRTRLDPPQWY